MKVQFDTGSSGVYLITDQCHLNFCENKELIKYETKASSYF